MRWAVTYTNPLAARWSGTPLGIPLHPVQVYAATGFLTLSILLLVWLPARRQQGDMAGIGLLGMARWCSSPSCGAIRKGAARCWVACWMGRKVAAMLVLVGGLMLLERRGMSHEEGTRPCEWLSVDIRMRTIDVPAEAAGQRLDQFIAAQLEGVSRSRVQLLMEQGDVLVNGEREKASLKLRGGERIAITGEPHPAPLKATAEDIPWM